MESLEKKQEYLRNNILEKGYNGDDFLTYLQEKKGEDGTDLNNWNLSELKDIVKEFIALYNPINNQHENQIEENPPQKNNPHTIKIGNFNNYEIFENNNYYMKYIYNNESNQIFCKTNDKTNITKLSKIIIKFGFP